MAESAAKKNSLTSTQEGLIAGVVILFFGLLYWYLNPWKTEDKATPATTQQATGGVVRSSLASDTSTSPSEGSNIAGNFTDNVQTTTTSATSNTESTSTNTTTTTASVAPPPYPSETTAKPLASTEAAKVASTTTAATTAEPTQEPAATPTASSTQTATETAAAPTITETAKPADSTTSTDTTKVETATETAAAPTVTANTSTEAAKTAPATETAASTTTASPAVTETASTTATPTASTNSNTATSSTSSSTQTTTPAASKLVLAPNSPEAKLQGYLETGTLETPVTIPNLQFEPKATKLTKDSEAEALMLAALLGQYPQANFLITAYTTESTKEQNSEQLSLQRANALGEELVKAGIDGKRITIMGMGNKPAADKSSAAQKKNQRIEISVIQ